MQDGRMNLLPSRNVHHVRKDGCIPGWMMMDDDGGGGGGGA